MRFLAVGVAVTAVFAASFGPFLAMGQLKQAGFRPADMDAFVHPHYPVACFLPNYSGIYEAVSFWAWPDACLLGWQRLGAVQLC